MPLHVYIDSIPQDQHRYPTVGDYWRPAVKHYCLERTEIRVSEMQNEAFELCVAIHELVEEFLTRSRGIAEADITAFDIAFEKARAEGSLDEPGDSPDAPYHKEHIIATEIEKLVAAKLDINWDEYEAAINNLF